MRQEGHMAKQESRWHRLLGTFRRGRENKEQEGSSAPPEPHRLKHSHNCASSQLRVGVSNMKGYKKSNQDRCTAFSYLEGDPDLAFLAVYDGHGGTGVANYLKDHLHEFILAQPEYREGDIPEALLKAFLEVDAELRTYGNATELTGSTATCVLIKQSSLLVANLGDSRAVASVHGAARQLTQDHNTSNPRERDRVTAMGGVIKENRVGGILIPTRSFGDFLLKAEPGKPPWKQVISPVPQIEQHRLEPSWDFIILATDGVWDAMSSSDVVTYVRGKLEAAGHRDLPQGHRDLPQGHRDQLVLSSVCEQLLDTCCNKTVDKFGKNSCDNLTVILIVPEHGGDRSDTGSSALSSTVSSTGSHA